MLFWQIAVAKKGLNLVKNIVSNNNMDDLREPMSDDMFIFKIAKKVAVPVVKFGVNTLLGDDLYNQQMEDLWGFKKMAKKVGGAAAKAGAKALFSNDLSEQQIEDLWKLKLAKKVGKAAAKAGAKAMFSDNLADYNEYM